MLAILAKTKWFPSCGRVVASDVSREALEVAAINLCLHDLQDQICLIQSDMFDDIHEANFDVILANVPYVTEKTMRTLPKEYKKEPPLALKGGSSGMKFVEIAISEGIRRLAPDGLLVVEMGFSETGLNRAKRVRERFPDLSFELPETSAGMGPVLLYKNKT